MRKRKEWKEVSSEEVCVSKYQIYAQAKKESVHYFIACASCEPLIWSEGSHTHHNESQSDSD